MYIDNNTTLEVSHLVNFTISSTADLFEQLEVILRITSLDTG